jgi:hypothetical protein
MKERFMLKKSLIFGSVALLITALIALTGCSQATDGKTTVLRENYIYGDNVTAESAQKAVDSAILKGRPIILADGLIIKDSDAVVDFKDADVRVEGTVNLVGEDLILNTAHANVTYVDGGLIVVDAGAYFIYNGDGYDIAIISAGIGTRVQYTTSPMKTQGTAYAIAIDNYELNVRDFMDIKADVDTIFVLDTLTVNNPAVVPTSDRVFVALGDVDVVADNPTSLNTGNFVFGPGSTLINSAGTVTVGLLDTVKVRNIAPIAGSAIIISGAADNLTIAEKVQGPGEVRLAAAALGHVTIWDEISEDGKLQLGAFSTTPGASSFRIRHRDINKTAVNKGTVQFNNAALPTEGISIADNKGNVNFIPPLPTLSVPIKVPVNDGAINFGENVTLTVPFTGITTGAGKVVFYGTFNAVDQGVEIGTDVVFGQTGATISALLGGPVWGFERGVGTTVTTKFNGNVDVVYGGGLNFGTNGTPANVTLKKGKQISVGGVPLLAAGPDDPLVFAPTTNTLFALVNPLASDAEDAALVAAAQATLVLTSA